MSGSDLTSEVIKQQHAAVIPQSDTFKPQGVSEQDARAYLDTDEGAMYWFRVAEAAAPGTHSSAIDDRAVNQIMSGRELPRMEIIGTDESLVKIVRAGESPSEYSPYWTRESELNAAVKAGKNLSDHFGLPIASEAARYDAYRITPKVPTQVFVGTLAPTSELKGLVTKTGGAEQFLVPNRKLFNDPVYVRSVDNTLAVTAETAAARGVAGLGAVGKAAGAGGVVLMAYDVYQTTQQYQALSARGNQFGADALLHQYEGRTAGGFIGGFAAGAAYGAVAGSESGPGALVTGAVGGVVGAFAGDKIATAYNEYKVDHQTGTDGVTYAYDKGRWAQTEHHLGLSSYDLPTIQSTTTPAPAEQRPVLDYQRTTAVTELALANPSTQDTKNITLNGVDWHASLQGWTKEVQQTHPGLPQADEFGRPITVSEPADAKTAKQLDQIAANRQYNNAHYKEAVAQAYVMDYYGKGWNQHGPLPEAVTQELKRPSETQIKDPATGHIWTADGEGHFSREETTVGYDTPVTVTVKATGDELARVGKLQQVAMQSNAAYGSQLIAEKYTQLQQPLTRQQASAQSEPSRLSGHAAVNPTVAAPSPFFREMSAKLDRFDQAMQSGDRAAAMKEVAHVERSPPWQADYERARATVAKEQQQREQQRAENPRDPRDAGHPDHAMNQSIRRQVETLHERAGYFISNKELDHLTASVANDARQRGMTRVDHVEFSSDKNQLIATQQDGPQDIFAKHSATNIQQAMQAPPEHAYQQMAQETQRQAQVQQGIQQQAAQSQQQAQSPGS